jgi:hypothetical protein
MRQKKGYLWEIREVSLSKRQIFKGYTFTSMIPSICPSIYFFSKDLLSHISICKEKASLVLKELRCPQLLVH